jgi:hypothetical protein
VKFQRQRPFQLLQLLLLVLLLFMRGLWRFVWAMRGRRLALLLLLLLLLLLRGPALLRAPDQLPEILQSMHRGSARKAVQVHVNAPTALIALSRAAGPARMRLPVPYRAA